MRIGVWVWGGCRGELGICTCASDPVHGLEAQSESSQFIQVSNRAAAEKESDWAANSWTERWAARRAGRAIATAAPAAAERSLLVAGATAASPGNDITPPSIIWAVAEVLLVAL